MFLESEIRKEIHKPFEYQHVLMAVVDGCNVFGGAAALETGGAKLSSVAVVWETDSEIRVPVYPIVYLPAITPGDVRVYASLFDIAKKGRMFERPDVEDLDTWFPGLSARNRWRSLDALRKDRRHIETCKRHFAWCGRTDQRYRYRHPSNSVVLRPRSRSFPLFQNRKFNHDLLN